MVINYRRDLHKIPELAMEEYKTSEYLKNVLKTFKTFEIEEVIGTGILAFKKSKKKDAKTIGFRADMDALPVFENTNREFKSTHSGKMHACGHDGHMSMVLELGRILEERELDINILLIFQPAEEKIGGASQIIEKGHFEKYNPTAIFGMHIMPEVEEGKIGMKKGAMMASATEFNVEIIGRASHCARPNEGVDSIIIGSELVQSYNQLLAKRVSPFDTAVIHVGSFHSGEVRNIVSPIAKMKGTIRTYDEKVLDKIRTEFLRINNATALKYDATINTDIIDMYPALINSDELYYMVKELLGDEAVDVEPSMAAEDFAFYKNVCPSLFCFLGSKSEKYHRPLHHDEFDFDEKILEIGVNFFSKIVEYYNNL